MAGQGKTQVKTVKAQVKTASSVTARADVLSSDVGECRRAQEDLLLTQFSIDHSSDLVHWVGRDGRILNVNESGVSRYGYSREEMLRLTVFDLNPGLGPESWADQWEATKKGGAHTIETMHRAKDGELFPVEVAVNYIEYQGAEYFVTYARDISARKRMETALEEEIVRRRVLTQESRDGIVVVTEHGAVVEANEQFAKMLGYTLDEVNKIYIWDWEANTPKEQLLGILKAVGAKGDHFETRHRRKDGTIISVEISTNAAFIGEEKQVFCICRDITERKGS